MKNKIFYRYCIFACLGVLLASAYPLYMGIKVVADMLISGTVMKENYPKYIIPYTPICIAVFLGVLLMPIFIKLFKKYSLFAGSVIASSAFFAIEILLENKVVITTTEAGVKLQDWQMYMCYAMPLYTYKTQTPVEILMGEYDPAFKLHFYVISIILILSVLNCIYGFAKIIVFGDKKRLKPLIMQSISALAFLGMCLLACFTAFWRDGNLEISTLSAVLMTFFFILMGVVGGIYIGSFLIDRPTILSVFIPSIVASALTLLMYIGEMILLEGNLYIFGKGSLFESIPYITLSPVDILIIIFSGIITSLLLYKKRIKH